MNKSNTFEYKNLYGSSEEAWEANIRTWKIVQCSHNTRRAGKWEAVSSASVNELQKVMDKKLHHQVNADRHSTTDMVLGKD